MQRAKSILDIVESRSAHFQLERGVAPLPFPRLSVAPVGVSCQVGMTRYVKCYGQVALLI